MLSKFLILPIFLFVIPGCDAQSPEELDRLMKEDSVFRQMIESRDQMRAQTRFIKADLLAKKKAADAQVDRIKQEYDLFAKAQNKKIEQYEATIETHRKNLKEQIEAMSAELSSKQKEFNGYAQTLADMKKLRNGHGLQFSPQERQRWEEKIMIQSEKMRPLFEEIQELKLQIRLKKKKVQFLV